jgi:hypothetical protein
VGIAAAGLAVWSAGFPNRAQSQSIDSILARVVVARGGLGVLHTVRSKRLTGRLTLDSATTATIVIEQRRPNMIREEITTSGQTLIRAFDGVAAWTRVPTGDDAGIHTLTGDDVANIAAEADFDGALIDGRVKGNRIELSGRDTVDGRATYKLKVTLRSGYVDYYDVDSATALAVRWVGTRTINGNSVVFESFYRDYFTVSGQQFIRVIDLGSPGSAARQQMVFDHIDINPPLDNARFTVPIDSMTTGVAH